MPGADAPTLRRQRPSSSFGSQVSKEGSFSFSISGGSFSIS